MSSEGFNGNDTPLSEGVPRDKDGNLNPDVLRGLAEMFRRALPNGGAENDNNPNDENNT